MKIPVFCDKTLARYYVAISSSEQLVSSMIRILFYTLVGRRKLLQNAHIYRPISGLTFRDSNLHTPHRALFLVTYTTIIVIIIYSSDLAFNISKEI
jgi:hypothetical protein